MTFGDVFGRLVRRLGKDSTVTLSEPLPGVYSDAISDALRVGWESAPWPRAMVVEERAVQTVDTGVRGVELEEDGEAVIGWVDEEACVFEEDPRAVRGQEALAAVVQGGWLLVPEDAPGSVWVVFRPPAERFTKGTDDAKEFPAFLATFCVLWAAAELLADDQARFRTRAAAEAELERVLDVDGPVRRARR